jgi:hypothetical protein
MSRFAIATVTALSLVAGLHVRAGAVPDYKAAASASPQNGASPQVPITAYLPLESWRAQVHASLRERLEAALQAYRCIPHKNAFSAA